MVKTMSQGEAHSCRLPEACQGGSGPNSGWTDWMVTDRFFLRRGEKDECEKRKLGKKLAWTQNL